VELPRQLGKDTVAHWPHCRPAGRAAQESRAMRTERGRRIERSLRSDIADLPPLVLRRLTDYD